MIRWDIADPDGRTGGSGRFWDIEVEAWREGALALRLVWKFLDYSPFIPQQRHTASDLVLQVAEIHLAEDRAITVTLAKSITTLSVPVTQSILDTPLDAGHAVPHDCNRGACSLCITRVLEGKPEHRELCLDNDERKDSMCVCISRARPDHLILDL